jgi:DNA processing protein
MNHHEFFSLKLSLTQNVGPVTYRLLKKTTGSEEESIKYLQSGLFNKEVRIPKDEDIYKHISNAIKNHTEIITEDSEKYPKILKKYRDSPPLFFCKGNNKELLHKNLCGFIGARYPAIYSIEFAKQVATEVCKEASIISGMAIGIDTIGHQESIKKGSIGVLAGGVDVIYPEQNSYLYNLILSTGCIVSTQPCGTKPSSCLFPMRNKFLAALADKLIVIEASQKSGSLITAQCFNNYKKPLFVVPGHPLDQRFLGNLELIKNGGKVFSSLSYIKDIFSQEMHDSSKPTFTYNKEYLPDLSYNFSHNDIINILNSIGIIPIHIEKVSCENHLSIEKTLTIAIFLSLKGKVVISHNLTISLMINFTLNEDEY